MYHQTISSNLIKAARAYLNWSQDELAAAADLGTTTIRSLETGNVSLQSAEKVRKALERAGIEFTTGDGFKRREDLVQILQSPNSCDDFFGALIETIEAGADEVLVAVPSQEMLMRSCGVVDLHSPTQLIRLGERTDVKCLLSEIPEMVHFCIPRLEFRLAPRHMLIPSAYYIFGGKIVIVLQEGRTTFRYLIVQSPLMVQSWRRYFLDLWKGAAPSAFSEQISLHRAV